MKKVYLLSLLLCLGFAGFSANWYSQGGAVNTLSNWNSLPGGTGSAPTAAALSAAGDTWIIQGNMNLPTGATWTIAGNLQINSNRLQKAGAVASTLNVGGNLTIASGAFISTGASAADLTINIGGNLSLAGSAYMEHQNANLYITLSGNLSMTGTSYFENTSVAGYNYITFNNTSSTLASPQTITWTSTGFSEYTDITINSGCVAQLNSGLPVPDGQDFGTTVNGTLVCGTFQVTDPGGFNIFTLAPGATIYSGSATGINGNVSNGFLTRDLDGGANYIFNGTVAQTTSGGLPNITSGGSVTINNTAGVTLTGTKSFASGATLKLQNGAFTTTATSPVMSSGSNVQRDNGTMTTTPGTYSGVNLTYMNLGPNTGTVTVGNEWPGSFTGSVTVNKTGATITLDAAKTLTGGITLTAGALDASVSNNNISLTGNWTNNAGTGAFVPRSATVSFTGSAAQTLAGSASTQFNNLTVTNTAGVNVNTNTNVSVTLNMSGATSLLTPAATVVFNNAAATGTINGTGIIKVTKVTATADYVNQYKFTTNTLSGLTVDYAGAGAQTINSNAGVGAYGTLKTSTSGTKSLAGAVVVNSDVNIGSGTTLDVTAGNHQITTGGNWTNSGSFTGQAGNVLFNATTTGKTITGTVTGTSKFYNLTFNGTGGAWTLPANLDAGNDVTITAGSVTAPTGTFVVGGNWSNAGSFNSSTGTVSMTATTTGKTLSGSMTGSNKFNNLTFNNAAGGWTFSSAADAGNNFTITAGSVTAPSTTLQFGGTFNNMGSFSANGGTVVLNGSSAQTITGSAPTTFNNLTLNNSAGASLTAVNETVNGVLSFTAGKLTLGSLSLNLNGTVSGMSATNSLKTNGSPVLTLGNGTALGTLFFDQTTPGTTNSLNTLTVNGAGGATLGNPLNVNFLNLYNGAFTNGANLTMANGSTISRDNGSLSAEPTWEGNVNITYTTGGPNNPTVTTGNEIPTTPAVLTSLTVNKAGATISLGSSPIIDGPVLLTAGTLDASASNNDITLTGNWTNNSGTSAFNARNATVTFFGSSAQLINGTASTTFNNLTLNNAAGVSMGTQPQNINGILTFTAGKLTVNTGNLIMGTSSSVAGTPSATAMIRTVGAGQLRKLMSANGSFTFPIGDATNYTPISVNFTGGTYSVGAYATATVNNTIHPNNASAVNYLNRYWTVTTSGITSPSYSVSATYIAPGDVTGSESAISSAAFSGSLPWVKYGAVNTATHTLSSGTVTGSGWSFSGITTAAPSVTTSGSATACVGNAVAISASATGDGPFTYSWSPATGLSATTGASVNATPASLGTTIYTVTVTDANGITATGTVSVTGMSAPTITGTGTVCQSSTTTLSSSTGGGTWITGSILIATVGSSTGIVAGVATGTATISYSVPGCATATAIVTVLPAPSAITGINTTCVGSVTTLGNATSSGTWMSSNTTAGTVGFTSGIVAGIGAGTTNITYTTPGGCNTSIVVSVSAAPPAIAGGPTVCSGLTTSLTNAAAGTWSSTNNTVALIGSSSGVVSALATGTTTISYILNSTCSARMVLTVNQNPAPITGNPNVCEGSNTVLGESVGGGSWSTDDPSIATLLTGGTVHGVLAGSTTISYTMPTGCYRAVTVNVNSLPDTIAGITSICPGTSATLSNATTGGTWSSSNAGIANIGTSSGIVTGGIPGIAIITYSLSTGCRTWDTIVVNSLPGAITGTASVCEGSTVALTSATAGGTWMSDNMTAGTIDLTSGVAAGIAAGTSNITYTIPNGCYRTRVLTVNPLPAPLTGAFTICDNTTTTLSSATAGGGWSSSNTGTATVITMTGGNGFVAGVSTGIVTISYILSTGCKALADVTVNASPAPITGINFLCPGGSSATTTLSDATSGGTWSSGNTGVATISGTGVVSGVGVGTTNISYTLLSNGCMRTRIVTVNANPPAIGGPGAVCEGSTVTLTNAASGGAWSSSNVAIGSITGVSGQLTGITAGVITITYTASSGCEAYKTITVNAIPASIGGAPVVCAGSATTLSNTTPGGTWSSNTTIVATAVSSTGVINGVAAGTATIYYTVTATGCRNSVLLTVNGLPGTITGTMAACEGTTTTLSNSTPGGTWTSVNTSVAIINTSGVVNNLVPGTSLISYTLSTGCKRSAIITVNANPAAITGTPTVCEGGTTTLFSSPSGGTWTPNNSNSVVSATSGIVTGLIAGTSTITYALPTGCKTFTNITINQLPASISGIPSICPATSTTLSSASPGGTWASSNTFVAVAGSSTGVILAASPGTAIVTYTLPNNCATTTVVTVNSLPTSIGGSLTICEGLTTTLNNSTSGGTWTTSLASVATVTPLTAVVTGIAAGTTRVTYTVGTGCIRTAVITVNTSPASIAGATNACIGTTVTMTNSVSGGTWSSSAVGIANVGLTTGIVTGTAGGTTLITYKLSNGCFATRIVTVSQVPAAITGIPQVCVSGTATLTNSVTGGSWASGNTAAATIGSLDGVVSGISTGTTIITYTLSSGCYKTVVVTVNPLPGAIIGSPVVCPGTSSSLGNATTGGTWSSSNNTLAIAPGGLLYGYAAGTVTIKYTLPTGCKTSVIATINPNPVIVGNGVVCMGQSTTLSSDIPGGTWRSSDTNIARVNSAGIVDGYTNHAVVITYTAPTGCFRTLNLTVSPNPAAIISPATVCIGATITAANATPGGHWSSSDPANAFIASSSGVITGMDTGSATISYSTPLGCYKTTTVQVLPLPAPITGVSVICAGSTTTFSDDTLGGTWSSSYTPAASIDLTSGIAFTANPGVAIITYRMPSGCRVLKSITVNPVPALIAGNGTICQGSMTTLTNTTPAGSWSSDAPLIASVPTTPGIVSGVGLGTATIYYTLSTGCQRSKIVTVNPLPSGITGTVVFCQGATTTLSNTTAGGSWLSSNTAIATVGTGNGVVSGVAGGTALISYKLGTGCFVWTMITVNPTPSTIGGVPTVCEGDATLFTNSIPGGNWSSSSPATAIVNTSGNVFGMTAGTATITYSFTTGCGRTKTVTVNPLPDAITGTANVCAGLTTTLASATTGGAWSSGNPAVAAIGSTTGVVTGITGGTSIITYTLASTGCRRLQAVTVNTLPATILGTNGMCEGASITLTNATAGGSWVSAAPAIATVGSANGIVTGAGAGTTTISYVLATGCSATTVVTVYAVPPAITGVTNICAGTTGTMFNAIPGGTWTSGSLSVASIGASDGIVTAILPGTSTITYSLPFGCRATTVITVNTFAAPIAGGTNICVGSTSTLTNATIGGTWSSGNTTVATIGVSSGVVSGIAAGTSVITYTTVSGCMITALMVVTPTPGTITGTAVMCEGSSVTLTNPVAGGTWTSASSTVATAITGTGVVTGVTAGTTTITYWVGACATTIQVTVNPAPPAITGFNAVCTQMTTVLSNSTPGGVWSSSDPAIASISATGVVSGLTPGTSMITYQLTEGCYVTLPVLVNTAPHANIDVHPLGNLCSNTQFQNIGTGTPMPAGTLYTWAATNAVINYVSADRKNTLMSFPTPGTSMITLQSQVSLTGCIVTDTLVLNVTSAVSPNPGIVYYAPHLVCTDNTADSYQWGYDDNSSYDSVLYPGEINQDLLMPVLDLVNKAYWVITMHKGCMQKTYYNMPTGVTNVTTKGTRMRLYPNPADATLNIESDADDASAKVYDLLGRIVAEAMLPGGKATVDVSRLPAGTYSVIIFSNGEKKGARNFIKN